MHILIIATHKQTFNYDYFTDQVLPNNKNRKNDKKTGPSPSTLRHAVKKAEETMTRLTAEIARIDDDMATASVSNPKALEGLTRARAKTEADLAAAEAAWVAAEEALAEVA